MSSVLSVFFYLLVVVFTLLYFLLFGVVFLLTVAFDRKREVIHHLSRFWTRCYFWMIPGWRVQVEGLERVDRTKPWVVVVNHQSMVDIPLMYVLPLDFKWVAKKGVYKWPIFGWVMRMHGDIGIERGTTAGVKKMIHESRKWLSMGVSVIVFPEGTRSRDLEIHRFKEGAFVMAQRAEVGILPCVSDGSGHSSRGWRIRFGNRFRVRVLPPVSAEEVAQADVKELTARMQRLVREEYEKIRNKEVKD